MNSKFRVSLILLFLVTSNFISNSQYILIQSGYFKVVNYKLNDDYYLYRIYEKKTNICISGGEMHSSEYYNWNYFTNTNGKYEVVIYKKPYYVIIREIVEVK